MIMARKYKVRKEYKLEDVVYDIENEEECKDMKKYAGTYILRRLGHGAQRRLNAKIIKIQTSIKKVKDPKDKIKKKDKLLEESDFDVTTDLSEWQNDILIYTLIQCPVGKQGELGWGTKEEKVRAFMFNMPIMIGDELAEIALDLNNMDVEEAKK